MTEKTRGPRVHRAATMATWRHTHKWGSLISDSTDLTVTRRDAGGLTISYGSESIEIRTELVAVLAAMVADAAEWSDTLPPAVAEEASDG